MRPRAFQLLTIAALAGCASVEINYIALDEPPRGLSPIPVEAVDMYTSRRPERPHVEVGIIEGRPRSWPGCAPPPPGSAATDWS
jgi:hypothetical protein